MRDQEDLLTKIAKLSHKVKSLEATRIQEVSNVTKAEEFCSICESVEQSISECPKILALKEVYHEQVHAFNQTRQ